MKKRDFILIFIILLLAGFVWAMSTFFHTGTSAKLLISVENKEYGIYDLTENQVIAIGDTNICEIKDGYVSMTYADCPDKVCVHSAGISKNGQTIICMPNRVVLEIIGDDADNEIDTIVE